MKNEPICPFSFIGEKFTENEDMNEIFIAGYRDKVCSDYTHSLCIDEIKESINFDNPTDTQIMWMKDIKYFDNVTLGNAILQYLIDQTTDLTINTLIVFMQNAGMPIETIDCFVADLHGPDKIREKIEEIFSETELPIARIYPDFAQFQLLNIALGSVYSKIVSRIFETFIDKIMSMIASTGINDFYAMVYRMVYDSDPVPTTYSNMYNLCMGTMREILDRETINYRGALMQIGLNAVKMVSNAPRFGLEVSNPNYVTTPEEFIKKCF